MKKLTILSFFRKGIYYKNTQLPSSTFSTGYSYCPSETVKITHTGVHHWVLLSTMYSNIAMYDSLNLQLIFYKMIFTPETLKYRVGVQRGQSYLMGKGCLFSYGWPPF